MIYSRWASKEEILNKTTQINNDSDIKKSGIEFMYDENNLYIDDSEVHNLVIGSTGSGKTQATMLPQLRLAIKANESFVVNDIKGEIYNVLSGELAKQGYKVYTINLAATKKGNNFNPFALPYKLYKDGDIDTALEMIENIGYYFVSNDTFDPNQDPFWEISAANLFTGLVLYLFENEKIDNITINNVSNLVNDVKKMENYLNDISKDSLIYTYLSTIYNAPSDTKGSIITVFKQKIKLYTVRESLSSILSYNNIDLLNIQKDKTAIFIINENKSTTKNLVSMIIDQCYYTTNILKYKERRLNFYIDDFENIKDIKHFVNILNLARGNNIRFNIYLKSFLELDTIYGKQGADLLKMSFGNIIYLLANDIETLNQISKLCGRSEENTPLISEEELKTLNYFEAIIISPRMHPIKTKLLPDYQIDWKFEKKVVEQPDLPNKNENVYDI
ncbi:MAG: type IV secretory system conjugative DNA transfer family protein [Bacilli bacterium]|nr:type IV secretory system conjugative DNA transfer family protein [Bacilli bacterium]